MRVRLTVIEGQFTSAEGDFRALRAHIGMPRVPGAIKIRHGPLGEGDVAGKGSESERVPARTVRLLGRCRKTVTLDMPADARIEAIAERQHGRVSRKQLLDAGVSGAAIGRRLRNGRLRPVHAGVYALPGTEEVPLGVESAALLACGEEAVLSHHSAVTLWGMRPGGA